jgi:hypothetical protein
MDKTTLSGISFAVIMGLVIGTVAALSTPPEASHAADRAQVVVDEMEVEAFMVPEGHVGPIVATEADGSVF